MDSFLLDLIASRVAEGRLTRILEFMASEIFSMPDCLSLVPGGDWGLASSFECP